MDPIEQFLVDFRAKKFGGEHFEPNLVASSGMNIGEIVSMPGVRYLKTLAYDEQSMLQLLQLSISILTSLLLLDLFLHLQARGHIFNNRGVHVADQAVVIFTGIAILTAAARLLVLGAQWPFRFKVAPLIETLRSVSWPWETEPIVLIVLALILLYIAYTLDDVPVPPVLLEEEARIRRL